MFQRKFVYATHKKWRVGLRGSLAVAVATAAMQHVRINRLFVLVSEVNERG
jgi:hypothetical protein